MMALTNAVVRLLEGKTGEAPTGDFARGGIFDDAITAVAETTNLSEEDIQFALNDGKTFADIIEENGGDLEAVKTTLAAAVAESEFLQDQNPDEFITNFLEGGSPARPSGNE